MSYLQVLDVIGRLYVDARFRAAFLADAASALGQHELAEEERLALAGLSAMEIALLGRMAEHHRWSRVQEHLPWADPAARPGLREALARYEAQVPPRLLNRLEAIAFCSFLEVEPAECPPYLQELARCERLRIAIPWGIGVAAETREEDFRFQVLRILADLGTAGWPIAEPEPTRVEFKKVPGALAVLLRARPALT